MCDLNELRKEIDAADAAIVPAFERRMEAARRIAAYKRENGLPVYQPDREKQVVEKAVAMLQDERNAGAIRRLYETLFEVSRAAQSRDMPKKAAYPGVEGSFSEKALMGYVGGDCERVAFPDFEGAARAVAEGECDLAMLPIENSTAGTVRETYGLLLKWNLSIVGERLERIEHFLLGVRGASIEGIREVRSHPQALAQCRDFLDGRGWIETPSVNTAVSAREIALSGDRTVAAIAGENAARRYDLTVLAKNIESSARNATRFVAVAKKPAVCPQGKASVAFRVADEVGALGKALACFSEHGLNMCALQSQPVPDKPWEYAFYADFDECRAEDLADTLQDARAHTTFARILGVYPKGETLP